MNKGSDCRFPMHFLQKLAIQQHEFTDIYKLTFYHSSQVSPSCGAQKIFKAKAQQRNQSVKDIQQLSPAEWTLFRRVAQRDSNKGVTPSKVEQLPPQKRIQSINFKKKLAYLKSRQTPLSEESKSYRQSFNLNLQREKSELLCPKIEPLRSSRNSLVSRSFPKEFSSNILCKRYFA